MSLTHAPKGTLEPGAISPIRSVPAQIERPEYVGKDREARFTGSEVKDAETVERIRVASRIAAQAVTEVICHGIPDSTVLRDGDIVNVDITGYIGGVHGDTSAMYLVGDVDEESRLLVERTHEAMIRGIRAVAPGRQVNVIGRVIEKYAARFGYGVVRDFTGHGVGESFHSGLVIPHYDAAPLHATVIEPGMVFTIEPMINLGTYEWDVWDDGWTVVTRDRRRSAQFEHTLVVTETGAEILTLP